MEQLRKMEMELSTQGSAKSWEGMVRSSPFEVLPESQVQAALGFAQAAFPRFREWRYCNQEDGQHDQFCLWGEYVHGEGYEAPRFYVTFDRWEHQWGAHLTMGQHAFMWSSADFGDAQVLQTRGHAELDQAILELKQKMAHLFSQLGA